MSSQSEGLAGMMDEKASDEIITFVVKTLVSMAETYPTGDGDNGVGLIKDIIDDSQEKLDNFTYNMTRIIAGLKDYRDNAKPANS